MNTRELAQRLYEEGCNPSLYAIGNRGAASDAFYLSHTGTQWQVCYTERGQDSPPIFASGSESQACEFFFKHIMSMQHVHCIGFFKAKASAEALQAELSGLSIASSSDRIPYGGPNDPRYRVYVAGKAIFAAREALGGTLPLRDAGA